MALQIWLPLDGTLENKGCANVNVVNNGATVDTSGKIGSCYSFDGSDDYISLTCSKFHDILSGGSQPFSVAMWIYHADETRAILFGSYSLSGAGGNNFFNLELSAAHAYRFDWKASPDWYPNNTTIGISTWSHLVCTYDGTKVFIYLNGSLTSTRTGVLSAIDYSGPYYLGRDSRTGATAFNGKMNDFRLYDHCLSAAEVHELSQGLVLHYKLSPYLNWLDEYSERSLIRVSGDARRADYTFNSALIESSDTSFIADFDAKGTANDMYVDVYLRSSSGAINISSTRKLTTSWDHYSISFTSTTDTAQVFSIRLLGGTADDVVYFKNVKLTSANMPLNSTKIIDSSGYSHNGQVVNSMSYIKDSRRYEYSINKPSGSAINCGRGGMVTDSLTVNLWAKWSTWNNPVSCTESGGWNFEGNPISFASYISGVGYESSTYPKASTQPSSNEWHMLTGVYDRVNQKRLLYVDGELASEKEMSAANPLGYNANNVIWLGAEASGSSTGFQNASYVGNLSDFRIYCTALSADDIKDLYQTSAKIDKLGEIHAFEFIEDNDVKVTKTGFTEAKNFIQNGYIINEGGSIVNFKPGAGIYNACSSNIMTDFTEFTDYGCAIPITIDFDFTWTNFAFQSEPAGTTLLQTQGTNRLRSDGTWKWQGRNNVTANVSTLIRSAVNSATSGSQHITVKDTIASEWFETYDASNFSFRCDYSDGNGTLTVTNFKVMLGKDIAKFNKEYISANEFIER